MTGHTVQGDTEYSKVPILSALSRKNSRTFTDSYQKCNEICLDLKEYIWVKIKSPKEMQGVPILDR